MTTKFREWTHNNYTWGVGDDGVYNDKLLLRKNPDNTFTVLLCPDDIENEETTILANNLTSEEAAKAAYILFRADHLAKATD